MRCNAQIYGWNRANLNFWSYGPLCVCKILHMCFSFIICLYLLVWEEKKNSLMFFLSTLKKFFWFFSAHQEMKEEIIFWHFGNTRLSHTCLIQECQFYRMSLSKWHGCCQFHESMSMQQGLSIPWIHVYTLSPCQ